MKSILITQRNILFGILQNLNNWYIADTHTKADYVKSRERI